MPRIPTAERRDALIQAALRVVAQRGVTAATTRAIVAEAGMSLASFHYAFASHDELMAELIREVVRQEEQSVALPETPAGATVRDVLRAGIQSYLDSMHADPQREKAMFELTHYALRTPAGEHLARMQYEHYYALASTALAAGAEATNVVWDRPVEEVARILIALTDGLTLAWLVNRDDAAAASLMDFAADAVAGLARPA
ncbi:TetR/AcrR family transcriptional regulator [Leifsonia sp. YAF41]|uniref:TetR/AcrR family transcriptional regulator n=1 Tax=Leifsonia sp. YAF41 TaxID=3233086 RepID=UPI003F9B1F2C